MGTRFYYVARAIRFIGCRLRDKGPARPDAGPASVAQAAIDGSSRSTLSQTRVELCELNAAPE
jgi:hypothetical protein